LQRVVLASNFSLDQYPSPRSLADAPGSRQPPFSVGISILGLSAQLCIPVAFRLGSLRFLIPPLPTGVFCFPYG